MIRKFVLEERNILAAIFINSFIIFLLYFPQYSRSLLLIVLDHFFILFFLLEVVIKWRENGRKAYFEKPWNIFDFILVMGSLPSLLVDFLPVPDTSVLMVLRIFRLVRVLRFVRFVPNINKVLKGLGRALRASVFVFVALLILNFLLALLSCHLFGGLAPEYFGDPLISAYSIFQLFTLEGWNEIPVIIAQNMESPFLVGMMRLYFVVTVLSGGIFGMSLANAVFVDEMTMDNNMELEQKIDSLQAQVKELTELLKEDE